MMRVRVIDSRGSMVDSFVIHGTNPMNFREILSPALVECDHCLELYPVSQLSALPSDAMVCGTCRTKAMNFLEEASR